jgi:hypothetical protein
VVSDAAEDIGQMACGLMPHILAVYAARRTMPNGFVFLRKGRDLGLNGSA